MAVATFEGIVEAGLIRLVNGERLPENATVYIVVPQYVEEEAITYSVTIPQNPRIMSPHLANKTDAQRFCIEVVEEPYDA